MSDGRINYSVGLDTSQLRAGAQESKQILHGIGDTASKEGQGIDNTMKNVGKAVAGAFALQQVKDFAVQVAKVRGEFQQLEVAFKTLLGSSEKADALMSQLIKTAATTPFGMTEIAQGAKQLIAYGTASEDVNETLIRLGDIAAGLSLPIGDLAYLYGTTMVQGRLYTQDLNQFLGRGIPLMEELAKQFGVTKAEVKGLVEEGKVGFPQVQEAIWNLTNEGSKFGGLMEAQSHTITGQISNIDDAIEQMMNQLGKKSEGLINTVLGATTTVVENWETIGKSLLVVISTYGAYKAAVLAVAAAHKVAAIWGEVQAFLSLAKGITSAKDAMLLLNMATKANPIGLILGVVAAAAAAFSLFSENTSEASEMTTKFGEKASTAILRINTLAATLKGLTGGSTAHKKAMDDLNAVLEEYGVQAIQEGDSIDTVNSKREQAIELIKREAIERQRANALQQGMDEYVQKLKDAQSYLSKEVSGAMTEGFMLTDNKELQQNSTAIATIIGNVVEENISAIAGKTGDEYQQGIDKIYKTIQDRMRAIGISESTIQKEWVTNDLFNHQNIIANYIDKVQTASVEHERFTTAVNKSADSEKAAADSATTFADRVAATQRSLQGASDDVYKLYANIQNLMSKYNANTIGFTIKFNSETPKWMNDKSIPELQRLAKVFSSIGDNVKAGGSRNVNGKIFTKQELLQRGADYAQAAMNKQTAADDAAKKAAEAKSTKKTSSSSAASNAKRDKQQLEDEIASRNQQIEEYTKSVIEKTKQSELDIRQSKLNMQKESFDKELAQNELNYDRLVAENEARLKDMLKGLEDKKMLEYENAHPKATKKQELQYRQSLDLSVTDLSPEQQAQIKAYADIAEEIRVKANKDSLDKMLENVLTYEQKREKTAKEYEEKRKKLFETDENGNYTKGADGQNVLRKGVTQGNVDELNSQEEEALRGIDEQFASKSEEYQAWCESISELSLQQLEKVLAEAQLKLEDAKNSGTASEKDVAVASAKVTKAQNAVNKANAKNSVSPNKRAIKEWEDLYGTLNDCEKEFENIGDAVGGVAGEIIKTAGQIMSSTLQMINGIVQLVNMSATGMQGTAVASSDAIATVEKASVILTVISAALQIAMTIINLFNSDEEKQAEIDSLQDRIDQLEWELEHRDIATLEKNNINSLLLVRQIIYDIRQEFRESTKTYSTFSEYIAAGTAKMNEGAERLAAAYANVAYSADKALGGNKYKDAKEQLENIAAQQMNINRQIEAEGEKKDSDNKAIQDYENKIKELGEQAITLINDMIDEIIGGSSSEISEQLSDAFFEAFQNGEDAAKAWGDTVNDIIADVLKRMMVQKFLEEPLGDIFDKYKRKWFKDGNFAGIDTVIASMNSFASDLNGLYPMFSEGFQEIMEALPTSVQEYLVGTAEREAEQKGIATASQESVDELNGRMTAVQGHTYSISENTKILVQNTGLILQSVMKIENNTDGLSRRMENVETNIKAVKDTVNEIALNGLKIK